MDESNNQLLHLLQYIVLKYSTVKTGGRDLSIDGISKIAGILNVSLDFLVGESKNASFYKRTLQRIQELELFEEGKKETLFDLIDTYIRSFKTRGVYSSL